MSKHPRSITKLSVSGEKKSKKPRVEKTDEEAEKEFKQKRQEAKEKKLKKAQLHDFWLISRAALSAKVVTVAGQKKFVCPQTGDTADQVYALPIPTKDDKIIYKG